MKNLKLGDITVKDKGDLGSDFYIGEHRIMWLNTMGGEDLSRWLRRKPIATEVEIDRVSSGRIRPLPKRKQKTDQECREENERRAKPQHNPSVNEEDCPACIKEMTDHK